MAKLVGIVLMVVAIYVALTVATEGVDGAFGGVFAAHGESADVEANDEAAEDTPAPRSVTSRVREKMQRTADERAERIGSY
jgi:hypothetical protein